MGRVLPLIEGECLYQLFGILLHRRFAFSVYPLIHSFIHSFIYISMDPGVLISYVGLWCNITSFILLFKLFQSGPLRAHSFGSCPFDTPPALCFCSLSTSPLSDIKRHSRLVLSISCCSLRISRFSKEPWPLLLENGIRNQDLGKGVFVAVGVSLFLGSPIWKGKEMQCISHIPITVSYNTRVHCSKNTMSHLISHPTTPLYQQPLISFSPP